MHFVHVMSCVLWMHIYLCASVCVYVCVYDVCMCVCGHYIYLCTIGHACCTCVIQICCHVQYLNNLTIVYHHVHAYCYDWMPTATITCLLL